MALIYALQLSTGEVIDSVVGVVAAAVEGLGVDAEHYSSLIGREGVLLHPTLNAEALHIEQLHALLPTLVGVAHDDTIAEGGVVAAIGHRAQTCHTPLGKLAIGDVVIYKARLGRERTHSHNQHCPYCNRSLHHLLCFPTQSHRKGIPAEWKCQYSKMTILHPSLWAQRYTSLPICTL